MQLLKEQIDAMLPSLTRIIINLSLVSGTSPKLFDQANHITNYHKSVTYLISQVGQRQIHHRDTCLCLFDSDEQNPVTARKTC